jgi:hypothetical protein
MRACVRVRAVVKVGKGGPGEGWRTDWVRRAGGEDMRRGLRERISGKGLSGRPRPEP